MQNLEHDKSTLLTKINDLQADRDSWQLKALSSGSKVESLLLERSHMTAEVSSRAFQLAMQQLNEWKQPWEHTGMLTAHLTDTGDPSVTLSDNLVELVRMLAGHLDVKPLPTFEHNGRPYANPFSFMQLLRECVESMFKKEVISTPSVRFSFFVPIPLTLSVFFF